MTKNVLFVVGTLQTGGIERSVTDWCLYLKRHTQWQPAVVCLLKRSGPFLETLSSNGVPVFECNVHRSWFTLRFARLIRRVNPGVVHSQVAFSMPWQVMGVLLSGRRKLVFTQQNEYQNWKAAVPRLRLRAYFLFFFRFINHYTCVSTRVRESLCSLTGRALNEFLIIPNSVDTSRFTPNRKERTIQRGLLGLSDDVFLVGMVARFSPQKGHKYLVEAISILKERGISCKILLVGIGELETEIRSLVVRHELSEYVVFYGQATNVESLLQGMDCFILSSLWEGMPLALLEGMAAGLPAIGTDVAGTREVVQDGVNGYLIPPKDPVAIADAIQKMKCDPIRRKTMAANALAFVREKYSVEANIRSYLNLYEG